MAEQRKPRAKGNFHESFASGTVAMPSPRATGYVFTAVALIVAVIFRNNMTVVSIAGVVAALLLATSLLAPHLLRPLNIAWFKFGMLLHRIVNPLVMFLMFAIAFIPMGLLMRLVYDPLRLKRPSGVETYWLDPDPAETKLRSMKNQF
jgi:hypothetical protein